MSRVGGGGQHLGRMYCPGQEGVRGSEVAGHVAHKAGAQGMIRFQPWTGQVG